MRRVKRLGITALLVAATLFGAGLYVDSLVADPVQHTAAVTTPQTVPLNADTLFDLVNVERTKAGLKPLVRDARLDAIAQERATDMNTRQYFSHRDPITGENMVKHKDYCVLSSENIANTPTVYDSDYNQLIIQNWMDSKPHHDAILDSKYSLAGMAMSGTSVVQTFCQQ